MTSIVAAQLDVKTTEPETGGEGDSSGAVGTKESGKKRIGKPHQSWSTNITEVSMHIPKLTIYM
jgi:hypothetical protein